MQALRFFLHAAALSNYPVRICASGVKFCPSLSVVFQKKLKYLYNGRFRVYNDF